MTRLATIAINVPGASPGDSAALQKRRELAGKHLAGVADVHLEKLPGFEFEVAWVSHSSAPKSEPALPSDPSARAPGAPMEKSRLAAYCVECRKRQQVVASQTGRETSCTTCPLSGGNHWMPLVIEGRSVGVVSIRKSWIEGGGAGSLDGARSAVRARGGAVALGDAAHLLRLLVRQIETNVQIDEATERLLPPQQAAAASLLEKNKQAWSPPALQGTPPPAVSESRAAQLVQLALDYLHQNFSRPVSLQDCAAQLHLNPAYLCALFSKTVGVPFKTYLIGLRLKKAKELLSDPVQRVSEVAYAVGYTDEDYFRRTFKLATGSPPAAWRNGRLARAQSKQIPG